MTISINGSEVFAEASGSLAERSARVCPLALGCVDSRENEYSAVSESSAAILNFLGRRERLIILKVLYY
jgi:hypothetical protein